jgi:hypothetical protein
MCAPSAWAASSIQGQVSLGQGRRMKARARVCKICSECVWCRFLGSQLLCKALLFMPQHVLILGTCRGLLAGGYTSEFDVALPKTCEHPQIMVQGLTKNMFADCATGWVSDEGASACAQCNRGKYQIGPSTCTDCLEGKYSGAGTPKMLCEKEVHRNWDVGESTFSEALSFGYIDE